MLYSFILSVGHLSLVKPSPQIHRVIQTDILPLCLAQHKAKLSERRMDSTTYETRDKDR